jgi:hypothetical protein
LITAAITGVLWIAAAPCLPASSDWVTAGDLAAAVPALAAMPPETKLGRAPMPGAQRVFPVAELRRLAAPGATAIGQPVIAEPVCVAWLMRPIEPGQLVDAMTKSLGERAAAIELIDWSKAAAPPGEIVFPPSGVPATAGTLTIWRGFVHYAEGRRFPVWAKVRVGQPPPIVVERGESVELEVIRGSLKIRTMGRAESQGRAGESIPFTVLASGARVQGRLREAGRPEVRIP